MKAEEGLLKDLTRQLKICQKTAAIPLGMQVVEWLHVHLKHLKGVKCTIMFRAEFASPQSM